jgi:diacylglycerol kinase family enzyme
MRVIVLTNPSAGAKADHAGELRAALERAGVDQVEVREVPGEQIAAAAKEAAAGGADAVVAAGGDGTVSACAAALAGTGVALGILPTGTLNHFAKDLGLPLALDEAAAVVAAGNRTAVDVASVNGRVFVNNSSIGIYPRIVGHRDRQRQRLGRGKWIAMLLACVSVFRRYPTVRVRIGIGEQTVLNETPFVFVGNNRYELTLQNLGKRPALDRGELCLYFANRTGRFGFFLLALRAVLGRLEQARDFQTVMRREVWIETPKRELPVALDGEVVRLPPPLHYEVRPQALTVLAPTPPAATATATATAEAPVRTTAEGATGDEGPGTA